MNARCSLALLLALASLPGLAACGEKPASDLTIERLPDVSPSVPQVPTLPPPPFQVQYPDNCFSVYGVRRRGGTTMDTDVCVTGYIVAIYLPPECPEGRTCSPPAAPHLWIGDTREAPAEDRIMLSGYAENQQQIDEAVELNSRGRYEPPTPEQRAAGIRPIPVDLVIGAKIKAHARFTRMSGMGFNVSNGLLDYRAHEIVEPAPGTEPPPQ